MNDQQSLYEHLLSLPPRKGPRPSMTPANPQEQLEQFPENWSLIERLSEFAFSLNDVQEMPTKIAPPGSRAMTLRPNLATTDRTAFMVDHEFAHIHNPPIGSLHLTLPDPFLTLALDKGWALRHPLAIRGIVSPQIVFVFAPRDEDELELTKLLLQVSLDFASARLR